MRIKDRLLVKHAVTGVMLLDSDQINVKYTIEPLSSGWNIIVHVADQAIAAKIMELKHELNVFLFEEFDDKPILKNWYYIKEGEVQYDQESHRLTIYADSHILYNPEKYLL
jgi:hypothetical protein